MIRYLKFAFLFPLLAAVSVVLADSGKPEVSQIETRALVQLQRIALTNPPAGGNFFGNDVALNSTGTVAIIGAPNTRIGGGGISDVEPGHAFIYTRSGSTWTLNATLKVSNELDGFGYSVAINDAGTVVLVGAPRSKSNGLPYGAAYVFVKGTNGWTLDKKLLSTDIASTDWFGGAVALNADGKTALVGAPAHDAKGSASGAAYVFVRGTNDWTQQKKLLVNDTATGDRFGEAVALNGSGSTAVIGAPNNDDKGDNSGSAYIFTRSGTNWSQQKKLLPNDGNRLANFGFSVALNTGGSVALVGAPGTQFGGTPKGAAYVFNRTTTGWTQQKKLVASNGQVYDQFGSNVSLNGTGTLAFIGAYGDDTPTGTDSGSAYLFSKGTSGWVQKQNIIPTDGSGLASPNGLSRDGKYGMLGAPQVNTQQGVVYAFVNQ